MSEVKKKKGGQPNNTNSVKHGKYSDRDFLLCSCCVAKSKCTEFDQEKPMRVCVFEKKLEKPDLSTIEKLVDYLKERLTQDHLRLQRAFGFERLSGGLLDQDALRLEIHINNIVQTISKLIQISDFERRLSELERKVLS